VSRLPTPAALAVVLNIVCVVACTAFGAGAASAQTVGPIEPESPAQCTTYSTGADTRTACTPSASAPPGSALACSNYTVGSDTHADCAPVAQPGLGGPRVKKAIPAPPATPLRCSTYHIGSSTYTDCR
jgi:hypothetical protein